MEPERLKRRYLIGVFLIAGLTFLPTTQVGFMLDDAFLVPRVNPEWNWTSLRQDFTTNVHDDPSTYLYRPLLKAMVRFQYTLCGKNPVGYHIVSLLFHGANAVGVTLLALSLSLGAIGSVLAGVFYGVHPLIVDDLLAATGGESMAIFFTIACLVAFTRHGWPSFILGIIFYIAALLAKESAVVIPLLVALMYGMQGRLRQDFRRLIPLFVLLVPYFLLRHAAVGPVSGLESPLIGRFVVAAFPKIVLYAMGKVLFPWDLESWPPIPSMSRMWPLYLMIVGGTTVAVIGKGHRMAKFAVGWFLIALAPRIPAMMLGHSVFDKWISLASLGILVPLAWTLEHVWWKNRHWQMVASVTAAIAVFGWGSLSLWNQTIRGSDEKNYRWAMRHRPREFAAFRLAVIYLRTGRATQAVELLEPLHLDQPQHSGYANTLALAYWHTGQKDRAIKLLKSVLAADPHYGPAQENLLEMQTKR